MSGLFVCIGSCFWLFLFLALVLTPALGLLGRLTAKKLTRMSLLLLHQQAANGIASTKGADQALVARFKVILITVERNDGTC